MKNITIKILLSLLFLFNLSQACAIERVTYYHNDALGSPVAATDSNGALLWREAYRPYGSRIKKEDLGGNTTWFTGKQEEKDLGLSYFGARWYDTEVGRFSGIDPVGFDEGNIHSFNRYGYANGNPYRFVDPDGKEPLDYAKGAGNELASMAIMLNPVMYATSFFYDTPKFQYVDQIDGEIGEWGVIGVSSVVGGAGLARGSIKGAGKAVDKGIKTKVTSWAEAGVKPDLNPGRWVMKGEATIGNYLKTGLLGPKVYLQKSFPWIKFEKSKVPFKNPITDDIPTTSLQWPKGLEKWKGILGQRKIKK